MTGRKETKKSLTPGFISEHMQFIADAMLGRLARWLRFLGFDVLYFPDISDSELVRIAREQDMPGKRFSSQQESAIVN